MKKGEGGGGDVASVWEDDEEKEDRDEEMEWRKGKQRRCHLDLMRHRYKGCCKKTHQEDTWHFLLRGRRVRTRKSPERRKRKMESNKCPESKIRRTRNKKTTKKIRKVSIKGQSKRK